MPVLKEIEAPTTLICRRCGGPILPEQAFTTSDGRSAHNDPEDCHPEEGWNPHIDTE